MFDQQDFQQQYLKSDVETKNLYRLNKDRWNRRKDQQLDMLMKEHVMATPRQPMANPGEEVNSGIHL